jgi:copper(I)-binding protein
MSAKSFLCAAIALFAGTAYAADPFVTFSDVFARPAPGEIGVAFFTATSSTNDAVTGVSSDCCKAVEIHRTEKLNGVMSMRRIGELSLKKGTPTLIQPESGGGEHMMLIGLKRPLVEGDTIKVNFTFKKAPARAITFPVKSALSSEDAHVHQ